jgi:hypothetical protein
MVVLFSIHDCAFQTLIIGGLFVMYIQMQEELSVVMKDGWVIPE